MPERRFPPPWFIEDISDCFVVKASKNRPLLFIYHGKVMPPIPREIVDPQCRETERPPWQTSASTSYTVRSRNRDQFPRIVAFHHSGRTPTAADARHGYYLGYDAMQS